MKFEPVTGDEQLADDHRRLKFKDACGDIFEIDVSERGVLFETRADFEGGPAVLATHEQAREFARSLLKELGE